MSYGYGQLDPSIFGPGYGQLDPSTFGPGYGQLDPSTFGPGYGQLDPSIFGPGYGQLDPSIFASSHVQQASPPAPPAPPAQAAAAPTPSPAVSEAFQPPAPGTPGVDTSTENWIDYWGWAASGNPVWVTNGGGLGYFADRPVGANPFSQQSVIITDGVSGQYAGADPTYNMF